MTVNKLKIQMMLDPQQHQALVELAQEQHSTLPDLIRHAFVSELQAHAYGMHRQEPDALTILQRPHNELAAHRSNTLELNPIALIQRMGAHRSAEISTTLHADRHGWQRCCLDITFRD